MDNFYTLTGGKWWKVDFHLHSPGSYDYGHGDKDQKDTTPEEFLKCCMRAELDCIVIADHNTCEWALKLRAVLEKIKSERDGEFRDICIFPGIELSVQGNVHLLGVFDPDIDEKTLLAIPVLVGYDATLDTTTKSINNVIDIITENNGIAIPAHVDAPCGLLYEGMQSSIIKAALRTDKLLAMEVLGDNFTHSALREYKANLSFVVGSDSHSTDTIGDKYTWVKMGAPNIEAMRLALFDTEDGVIRYKDISGNPNERHGKTYLRSVEITNGKYIGRKETYRIEFSPWLNSLIGGRGSGKSAVLNFIRLILGREDELPASLQQDYKDFVKVPGNRTDLGMLQKRTDSSPGTIVTLEMCVDGICHTLKWEDGSVSEYDADSSKWVEAQALKERFPVRMFSQKQLFEMTGDTGLLFNYLDSKWDYSAWKKELVSLQRSYSNASRKLHELTEKQKRLEQLKVQLNDAKKKIGVFETEKTRNVLQKKEQLKAQRESIEGIYESFTGVISWINDFYQFQNLNVPLIEEKIDSETSGAIKKWCNEVIGVVSSIKEVLSGKEHLWITKEEWIQSLPIKKQIEANLLKFNEVIEELRNAGVDDVDRYAELVSEKENLEKEIDSLGNVDQEISDCKTIIEDMKRKWAELVKERYSSRKMVLSQWNQIGALKLSLNPFGDVSSNEKTFRQIIRRDNSSVFNKEILEYDEDGGLTRKGILYFMTKETDFDNKLNDFEEMKQSVLATSSTLGKRLSDYLSRLFSEHPDSISEFEMWVPKDSLKLEINLNKKGRPLYRSIDAGSPGQRTSAILSLILGISTMPIIIDQPEDDLDTRNITDIVVSSINEIKKQQQVIVVTHNPNIVVNTNSEQVVQLDYRNGQIINACSGALQNHDVRDAICEVMEGGKEALEKRYYRIFKALE